MGKCHFFPADEDKDPFGSFDKELPFFPSLPQQWCRVSPSSWKGPFLLGPEYLFPGLPRPRAAHSSLADRTEPVTRADAEQAELPVRSFTTRDDKQMGKSAGKSIDVRSR